MVVDRSGEALQLADKLEAAMQGGDYAKQITLQDFSRAVVLLRSAPPSHARAVAEKFAADQEEKGYPYTATRIREWAASLPADAPQPAPTENDELRAWREFGKTYGFSAGRFFEDGPTYIIQHDESLRSATVAPPSHARAVKWPKARGITRLADAGRTLGIAFERRPTDDEMREIHDFLRNPDAALPADAPTTTRSTPSSRSRRDRRKCFPR